MTTPKITLEEALEVLRQDKAERDQAVLVELQELLKKRGYQLVVTQPQVQLVEVATSSEDT